MTPRTFKTLYAYRGWLAVCLVVLLAAILLPFASSPTQAEGLVVRRDGQQYSLTAPGLGTLRRSAQKIENARSVRVPNSATELVLWDEQQANGRGIPFYAISLDGQTIASVQQTSYDILLRYAKFDPGVQRPAIPETLRAGYPTADSVYIVQFVTQPLDEFRKEIEARGGTIYTFLANHSYLVKMDPRTKAEVEGLPFVRWVGEYQPAYRLEEYLVDRLSNGGGDLAPARYNIMLLERGAAKQDLVGNRINGLGGKVELKIPEGFRFEATLTAEQLLVVAKMNEVLFIDRWSAPEPDMDIVRATGGANFIETTLGYTGQGVTAEVMDGNFLDTHNDFQGAPATMFHGTRSGANDHGSSTFGIVFGNGTANPQGRGMIPNAQKVFASYLSLSNRYTHTQELISPPYNAVFQSNSWGDATTTAYTTISAEMDDILFQKDFVILQSQSNTGSQSSRPQAWAKNIVSIGGVRHSNTPEESDDRWGSGASIGPATDGRIKPDLAHYYDSVFTPTNTSNTAYTQFSGTSAATPIVAGHFGIFFQMWHNGIFGNAHGATVFESRPHMTTAKAIMINTAHQWNPVGVSADLTRVRQGWGRPDLQNLYNLRDKMFIVNETDLVTNLGSKSYALTVPVGSTTPFKATLDYADPMGNPASAQHRINDLTLKVTSPSNVVYFGNNGLSGTGQWSTSGGVANTIDTVENVYIQTPEPGTWTVEVLATQIVQDSHTETPAMDADYALVVTGVNRPVVNRTPFDYDGDGKADISIYRPSVGEWYLLKSQAGLYGVAFGAPGDRIAPADYDGDGKTDVAVYRPSNGVWYVLNSSNSTVSYFVFGIAEDLPAPADYDGDGKADVSVFRPSNGTWYRLNSGNGAFFGYQFGQNGDSPALGDWDGDGKADISIYRPSNGAWYRINSSNGTFFGTEFGAATDVMAPGDFDGDGKTDVSVFRPTTHSWLRLNSGNGAFVAIQFGLNGDSPTPADYDGDGKADISVFRPSDGTWYRLNSGNGSPVTQPFGAPGDLPTPAAFRY
jgi:hypothetical protein